MGSRRRLFPLLGSTKPPLPLLLQQLTSSGVPYTTAAATMVESVQDRKAEVRKRLEEEAAAARDKKKKKGFMTPERKKKLRMLLRKKAAEELKREQEMKAEERRKVINERCGQPINLDGANEEKLRDIIKQYHERLYMCESQKWDLEYEVRRADYEINELFGKVNDLRGKFIKPTLKKVARFENKFAKLQKTAVEFNFKNQLKSAKEAEKEAAAAKAAAAAAGGAPPPPEVKVEEPQAPAPEQPQAPAPEVVIEEPPPAPAPEVNVEEAPAS